MLRGVRNGIGCAFSATLGVFSIVAISWGLISFWKSMPKPIQYEIMDVVRTTKAHECDTPYVTIIKNVKTSATEYRCGVKGRIHRIYTEDR